MPNKRKHKHGGLLETDVKPGSEYTHIASGGVYSIQSISSIKLDDVWHYNRQVNYHKVGEPEILYSRLIEDFTEKFLLNKR